MVVAVEARCHDRGMTTLELASATPAPRRAATGWVPQRHGAWGLIAVPLTVGIALAGWQVVHLPLVAVCFVGFLAFDAAVIWAAGSPAERSAVPVLTYGGAAVATGMIVLALDPALVLWLLAYVPLVALSLWMARRGQAGSLVDGGSAVLGGALMLPLAYDAGTAGVLVAMSDDGTTVWVAFAVVLAYAFGTVLYVTTMLDERGTRYYAASIGFHAVALVIMRVVAMSTRAFHPVSLVLLFGALVMRAAVLPRRGATPVQVAVSETGAALAVAAVLLLQAS